MNRMLPFICAFLVSTTLAGLGQNGAVSVAITTNGSTQIRGAVPPNPHGFPPMPPGQVFSRTFVFNAARRPYMGLQIRELNAQLAKFFEADGGVLVEAVDPDGPGDKAGARAGDVIVSVGTNAVTSSDDIFENLDTRRAGDQLALHVLRQRTTRTLTLTLAERPVQSGTVAIPEDQQETQNGVIYGAQHLDVDIDSLVKSMREHAMPSISIQTMPSAQYEMFQKEIDGLRKEIQDLRDALQAMKRPAGDRPTE